MQRHRHAASETARDQSVALMRSMSRSGRSGQSCRSAEAAQSPVPSTAARAVRGPVQRQPEASTSGKVFEASVEQKFSDVNLRTAGQRRWSNLDVERLVHRPGTVLGSAVLVAGTAIGAGILALPAVTQGAGFVPASASLLGCYAFSALTGLMIMEVNLNTVCELGAGAVSMQSMVKRTLGSKGAAVSSTAYVFLHYCLLVAYIARGSRAVADAAHQPMWIAAAALVGATGSLCFFSPPKVLDNVNTGLLAIVVLSFLGLVWLAAPGVTLENLERASWPSVVGTLPVVALAFVYQNIVPTIVTSLEGDAGKVRTAMLAGLAVPLLMFVGWEAAILGSIPGGQANLDPVQALQQANPVAAPLIQTFSFMAIVTSFIGFILGLTEFWQDVLPMQSDKSRLPAYALTLVPPYALALAYPDIFFQALDKAGTYGVMVLFGVLPAAMVWSERHMQTTLTQIRVVPGGRPTLLLVGGTAVAIIVNEFAKSIGVL